MGHGFYGSLVLMAANMAYSSSVGGDKNSKKFLRAAVSKYD